MGPRAQWLSAQDGGTVGAVRRAPAQSSAPAAPASQARQSDPSPPRARARLASDSSCTHSIFCQFHPCPRPVACKPAAHCTQHPLQSHARTAARAKHTQTHADTPARPHRSVILAQGFNHWALYRNQTSPWCSRRHSHTHAPTPKRQSVHRVVPGARSRSSAVPLCRSLNHARRCFRVRKKHTTHTSRTSHTQPARRDRVARRLAPSGLSMTSTCPERPARLAAVVPAAETHMREAGRV